MKTIYLKTRHGSLVSSFPNFSATGSVTGMKKQFYGKDASLVRCGSFIYNVPMHVYQAAKAKGAK